MPAVQAPLHRIISAGGSAGNVFVTVQLTDLLKRAAYCRMRGASTKCTAMYGNGARMTRTQITTVRRTTDRLGWAHPKRRGVSSAAGRGTTSHGTCVPHAGTGAGPEPGTSPLAFAAPEALA